MRFEHEGVFAGRRVRVLVVHANFAENVEFVRKRAHLKAGAFWNGMQSRQHALEDPALAA
jgi:hypothetical protein